MTRRQGLAHDPHRRRWRARSRHHGRPRRRRRLAPEDDSYDLVVMANLDPGPEALAAVLASGARALPVGGHLYVVAHHVTNLGRHGPPDPERLLTPERLRGALPAGLNVEVLDIRDPSAPTAASRRAPGGDAVVGAWATKQPAPCHQRRRAPLRPGRLHEDRPAPGELDPESVGSCSAPPTVPAAVNGRRASLTSSSQAPRQPCFGSSSPSPARVPAAWRAGSAPPDGHSADRGNFGRPSALRDSTARPRRPAATPPPDPRRQAAR